jgi:hypothetical protein
VVDATGRDADYRDERLFADPEPVPALRELMETGELRTTPETTLS